MNTARAHSGVFGKRKLTRYVIITASMGTLSFVIALVLLYRGVSPFISLVISACCSGLISYGLIEMFAFPHRKGKLSWSRLAKSSLVGVGGFAARYVVLTICLHLFAPLLGAHNKPPALLLAYLASFLFGYLFRTLVVFKR
ncbi:MAG: GtrA family protein [Planctomycetes bacterium]|nr:GtrA family protein [Planctomycetota bacterium]